MRRMSIPIVRSVEDEDRRMGRCECGGRLRLRSEEVIPRAGRWFDSLVVTCAECGKPSGHVFESRRSTRPGRAFGLGGPYEALRFEARGEVVQWMP